MGNLTSGLLFKFCGAVCLYNFFVILNEFLEHCRIVRPQGAAVVRRLKERELLGSVCIDLLFIDCS